MLEEVLRDGNLHEQTDEPVEHALSEQREAHILLEPIARPQDEPMERRWIVPLQAGLCFWASPFELRLDCVTEALILAQGYDVVDHVLLGCPRR